jgi:hypothetical protein
VDIGRVLMVLVRGVEESILSPGAPFEAMEPVGI